MQPKDKRKSKKVERKKKNQNTKIASEKIEVMRKKDMETTGCKGCKES